MKNFLWSLVFVALGVFAVVYYGALIVIAVWVVVQILSSPIGIAIIVILALLFWFYNMKKES